MAWASNRFCDFGVTLNQPLQGQQTTSGRNKGSAPKFTATSTSASNNTVSKLESLRVGTSATIIGIVIAKESPKSIFSRKSAGTERFLFSFVIRDSPTCFANATCWGSENYIKDLARTFGIGDVAIISNVQVQTNPTDGSEEKFRVTTPLPFHLNLSETHSSIALYDGLDFGSYASLQYIPTKPSCDFYTLEDVLANGQSLEGEHINLLAAVKKVGQAKDITTKTGRHTKRCELKLFDESCPSFPLVLNNDYFCKAIHEFPFINIQGDGRIDLNLFTSWGEEIVDYALSWTPMETVLFVADVRMNFDNFRQSMMATSDSKTVFTPNPDTVEGQCLYQFAQTQNFSAEDDDSGSREQADPPLDQIKEIVTIEEARNRKAWPSSDYVIIYGVMTSFDIDSENTDKFFRRRCPKCKHRVTLEAGYQCFNPECTQGALNLFNTNGEISVGEPEKEFSLPTSIADYTGCISQCRLSAAVIENMLGWNPNDLVQLEAERRTDFKWNFLLERCKFYVKEKCDLEVSKTSNKINKMMKESYNCISADDIIQDGHFAHIW